MEIHKETFNEAVSEILYHYDPALLGKFDVSEDEYTSEATDIILHLSLVSDTQSLKYLVYEVLVKHFSKETLCSKESECYTGISEEIWGLWQEKVESLKINAIDMEYSENNNANLQRYAS